MQTLILDHYPPVIGKMKEMQQIAKAEDIEFSKLHAAINGVICNMFVQTADESGIERFERMLGITAKPGQSLESRKIYVLFVMGRKKITLSELKTMLSEYCKGIEFICNFADAEMTVEMRVEKADLHVVSNILEETLPLNIYFHFRTNLKAERTKAGMHALCRAGGKLKVKAFVQERLKTEADGKIKAYQRNEQTIRIEAKG